MTWEQFEVIYNEYAQQRIASAPAMSAEAWAAFISEKSTFNYKIIEQSPDYCIAKKYICDRTVYFLAIRKQNTITQYSFGGFHTMDNLLYGVRVRTTMNIYTHPEQLDGGTFLRGDLSNENKIAIYQNKYAEILHLIIDFLK